MIAIPNMSKPKYCDGCDLVKFWVNGSFYCMADGEELNLEVDRRNDCPLIEIVQCKDCIYNSNNTDGDTRGWCYKHGIDIIGFCSEGERWE